MAKKESTAVVPVDELQNLPAYMQEDNLAGTEELSKFITPPRLKIVQPQSTDKFTDKFINGDVIVVPAMVPIVRQLVDERGKQLSEKKSEVFQFIPIFFFPEWLEVNPIQMKGTLPAIRARSLDPKSKLAALCRNPDMAARSYPCPENPQFNVRYIEALNYAIVVIGDNPASGTPLIVSFSKAEHQTGRTLNNLIKMRKAPIYGCVFEAFSSYRTNDKGQWYGLNPANPSEGSPWTSPELYPIVKAAHEDFKKAHEESRIVVDHDDTDLEDAEDLSNATDM